MKDFEVQFKHLVNEPAFKRLKRSFTNYSIFTFGGLKEDHTTNLINWLLNPREAHGSYIFFDYFLAAISKALETSVIENGDFLRKEIKRLKKNKKARSRYIFESEHNMGEKYRCDIVGISLDGGIPIFIENKISSPLSGDQLGAYTKYADKNTNCKPLLVLMDATPERDLIKTSKNNSYQKRWLPITYDWLGEAIQEYLSGPVPQEVSTILKSFQTELEPYISTSLDQTNIFWSKAWKDIEALGRKYYHLWSNETYNSWRKLSALEAVKTGNKLTKSALFIFKYPEIFDSLEDFGFFNTLEWSVTSNPGFEYETYIQRKNVYFHTGSLPEVEEYWAVNLKLSQKTIVSENRAQLLKDIYSFSLSYAPKSVSNEYSNLVKAYFSDRESLILKPHSTSDKLEASEVKKQLFLCLKNLRHEIDSFVRTPKHQLYIDKQKKEND